MLPKQVTPHPHPTVFTLSIPIRQPHTHRHAASSRHSTGYVQLARQVPIQPSAHPSVEPKTACKSEAGNVLWNDELICMQTLALKGSRGVYGGLGAQGIQIQKCRHRRKCTVPQNSLCRNWFESVPFIFTLWGWEKVNSGLAEGINLTNRSLHASGSYGWVNFSLGEHTALDSLQLSCQSLLLSY